MSKQRISAVTAVAAIPVYVATTWLQTHALAAAKIDPHSAVMQLLISRALTLAAGALSLVCVLTASLSQPKHLRAVWWAPLVAVAFIALFCWQFVGRTLR